MHGHAENPLKIRYDGFVSLCKEEEATLSQTGDAIRTKRGTVGQFHARTLEELLALAERYRQIATRLGWHCLFRGQTGDYYHPDGGYGVAPAAARPSAIGTPLSPMTSLRAVEEELMPWMHILGEELGINLGDCLRFVPFPGETEEGILRFFAPNVLTGRVASEPFLGILQHYGFPTHCLDVTPELRVAAWFALNKGGALADGSIAYQALPPAEFRPRTEANCPSDLAGVPSIQVYLQARDASDYPVFDLRAIETLKEVALRPVLQAAYSLPFIVTHARQPLNAVWTFDKPARRYPAAVIKLYFGGEVLRQAEPELTQQALLPEDDELYLALLEARVPRLAVYHATNPPPRRISRRFPLTPEPPMEPPPAVSGSVAENPKADEAWWAGADLLRQVGFQPAGSITRDFITYELAAGASVPQELRARIEAIATAANVAVFFLKQGEDSW